MAGKDESSKLDNPTVSTTAGGDACLIAKAVNRLVAMRNSRPRTFAKLSTTLQSCTAVLPYLNPMEALDLANKQADRPPPRVESSAVDSRVYVHVNSVDLTFWDFVQDVRAGKMYFTYPPQDIDEAMHEEALIWLQSMKEGTVESLLDEFHQRCRREQVIDVGAVFESLQSMGFVQADSDDAVTYHLPLESDVSALKVKMNEFAPSVCRTGSPWLLAGQSRLVHKTAVYHSEYGKWNFESESSNSDPNTFRFGNSMFPLSIDVTDIHALCILIQMAPSDRPKYLPDLLRALKSACEFLYVIPPANVLLKYTEQLRHRPVLEERMKPGARRTRVGNHEFAIGVSTRMCVQIPLTPEGLLGVSQATEQELKDADAVARWRINCQSRGFAAMLVKHLSHMLQQGVVLVQATGEQKSQIVNRVADWLDRYRSDSPAGETETDIKAGVQTLSQKCSPIDLQRELIAQCIVKRTKIPASAVATILEQQGFIRVDRDDPAQPVTYVIPEISSGSAPTWQVAAAGYWKASVKMCYAEVLARYFPPEDKKLIKKTKSVRPKKQHFQSLSRKPENSYRNIVLYSLVGAFIALIFGLLISWSGSV